MSELKTKALNVLKQYWDYNEFRSIQYDVIQSVMSGKDTLLLMNTGGGKSLCYQVPGLLMDGVTLILSPLIALQKDQVDALMVRGVPAAVINSTTGVRARKKILQQIHNKELKLLYISPETFFSDSFKIFKDLIDVRLICVDECHLASTWSDFRPDYQKINLIRETFPDAPILAVTATADDLIVKDVLKYCGFSNDYNRFQTSFDRANIHYNVIPSVGSASLQVLDILSKYNKQTTPGILYFSSRDRAEEFTRFLNVAGYSAVCYHAGLKKKEKESAQESFLNGEVNLICATIAFGIGVDKPNCRFVICVDPPNTLDELQQLWGRNGRDGKHSDAYLIYNPSSYRTASWLISTTTKNPQRLFVKIEKLKKLHSFCRSSSCRRKQVLAYFNEQYEHKNCKSCDICLNV